MSQMLVAGCCPRPIFIPLQASPGQDCTGPYPTSGMKHVRYSQSMCDLSGPMNPPAEATDSPDQSSPLQLCQSEATEVVFPDHKPVASESLRKLQCREARVPLSTSAANIRAVSFGDLDEPSEARGHRISTSYDWLFNSPLGQRPHDSKAEALDLVGPDPFRFVPTRAHVSEMQKSLQIPESTATGALRLTTSTSHGQLSSNSKVTHYQSHSKKRQEDVWWDAKRPAFIEDGNSKGQSKGKMQPRQIDSNHYPQTRL